ncbi:MAG: class I SAM-dependent methyltransferase [Rhodospirillales bacterium]|nr:class I SAM-dependent methyltransferase [Rhodospirillales bacterium]
MTSQNDDPVQAQYEAYPYPARDPAEEARRLVTGSPSQLPEVNHYLFAGRRDFAKPFRALAAGGGTGDAAIMLAQQLAECGGPGEVVYLDLSGAAREVAEARARARSLANIRFVTGPLEALPDHAPGPFDYIDCCGVLHHLADPAAGLRVLAAALAEGGGLGLMLYGEYGRTGVYPMQAMLRALGAGLPLPERVALARRLMAALPAGNWLRRNPYLGDHKRSDAELVDLFLHARDRAYTVPQVAELAEAAGLGIVAFIEPARYDPASYLDDAALLARLEGLSRLERAAFAEALAGTIKKHVFYAAKRGSLEGRVARPDRPEAVPCLNGLPPAKLAAALERELLLKVELDGLALSLPLPQGSAAMAALIDGRRSLGAIHAALQARDPGLDWFAFQAVFAPFYKALAGLNLIWLSYPDPKRP